MKPELERRKPGLLSKPGFSLSISLAGPDDLGDLVALLRADARESNPDDPAAPDRAEAGLRQSLTLFDWLDSDGCWLALARVNVTPAGYAMAVRIPKTDARRGFLFVDELLVLKACRRQGIASALLARIEALAQELGYAGVRLLVRPENHGARALYRGAGYEESLSLFCQKPGR